MEWENLQNVQRKFRDVYGKGKIQNKFSLVIESAKGNLEMYVEMEKFRTN